MTTALPTVIVLGSLHHDIMVDAPHAIAVGPARDKVLWQYRLAAADLRVAQGYVRCGRCSNVFNALARLSEDRQAAAAAAQAQATAIGPDLRLCNAQHA